MRICSACGVKKRPEEFSSRQSKCKACQKEYHRAWYLANKARVSARRLEWSRNNRERQRAISLRWARKHPDKNSRWSHENPDKRRAVAREWARRNLEKVEDHTRNRRARIRNAFVERVEIAVVRERDKGLCGICGAPVSRGEESLDHIVPLARGGEHSYRNVQLAHLSCNKRKNDPRGSPP